MNSFRFDPVNDPAETLESAEEQVYYFQQMIKSLEAKLLRIDPFEEDSERTMDELFAARQALDRAAYIRLLRRYSKMQEEIDVRNSERNKNGG